MKFLKVIFVLVALTMVFTPVMLSAQMAPSQDACMQAKMDAGNDVNGTLWLGVGFLLNFPLGWPILPMLMEPSPPASRLIGMPPDYVAYYTQCYKEAGKKIQTSKALTGCIVGSAIGVGCYFMEILFISAASY